VIFDLFGMSAILKAFGSFYTVPNPDGEGRVRVGPGCDHCTCDVSKTDNDPSTEDLPLEDPKCRGFDYLPIDSQPGSEDPPADPPADPFPPQPTSGIKKCDSNDACESACCDKNSFICSTPENSTCM
jgi:hypothetical protein